MTTPNVAQAPPTESGSHGGFYVAPRNWVLALILAVLVGYWFAGDGGGSISQRVIEPVVAGFDASRARSIVLERADLAAVDTGGVERTTMTRKGSLETTGEIGAPDVWIIDELHGAPAFADRVDRLLSRIGSMTTLDLVSDDAAKHAAYGLTEKKALRLRVSEQDVVGEAPMVDILIAPAPGRAAYVRSAGDDRVWRVARFSPPSPSPRAWFDDSSLMPLLDRSIKTIRGSGPALEDELVVHAYPGGDRFVDAAGDALSGRLVLDLFKRLRMLFPIDVQGAKVAGESLEGEPWLSIEVEPSVGGNSFRIDFAEPEARANPGLRVVRAARVQGTVTVSMSAATVEKLVLSLRALQE